MDSVYSFGLLIALVAGGLSVIAGIVSWRVVRANSQAFRKLARGAALFSFCSGLLSAIVHFIHGHGPATREPMGLLQFLLHHRAYWAVFILALTGILVSGLTSTKGE